MLYSYLKNSNANGIWTPIWSMPDNIWVASSALTDSGTCGFNSICTLGSDKRPIYTCPKGYSLLDPNDRMAAANQTSFMAVKKPS